MELYERLAFEEISDLVRSLYDDVGSHLSCENFNRHFYFELCHQNGQRGYVSTKQNPYCFFDSEGFQDCPKMPLCYCSVHYGISPYMAEPCQLACSMLSYGGLLGEKTKSKNRARPSDASEHEYFKYLSHIATF